jgi:FtsP/CotA-like multicopper oxidase with cupredoxin domain
MSHTNMNTRNSVTRLLPLVVAALALLLTSMAQAATPGISGTSFGLNAQSTFITQPDGALIYSWGYGCPAGSTLVFVPANTGLAAGVCPLAQIPGPTLVVAQTATVTVTLTNNLPKGAGNTSIVFTGATVAASGGVAGLLAREALPVSSTCNPTTSPGCNAVTYTLTNLTPGTHAYYSGTQSDLQVEMGLYGALVVLPSATPSNCSALNSPKVGGFNTEYRLAPAAYNHPEACYDREYLTQWAELDPRIHRQAEQQAQAIATCTPATNPTPSLPCPTTLSVAVEPYHPAYFLINGRSMPDDMDADYVPNYPSQPYNGNPHMHPGDLVLLRVIGQGRLQHPFHEHGNHVRILARDGNLILSQNDSVTPPRLAGRLEFTTDTTPGQAFDGIFYWAGKGLGWDIFGHTLPTSEFTAAIANASESGNIVSIGTLVPASVAITVGKPIIVSGLPEGYNGSFTVRSFTPSSTGPSTLTYLVDPLNTGLPNYTALPGATSSVSIVLAVSATDPTPCIPDHNGYYTVNSGAPLTAVNYYEWCADHNHPLETNPVGQTGGGGPMTLPDPLIMTNGLWYNGTPYLGPDAVGRSRGTTPLPPTATTMNPLQESGIAFMWHSHNEREITTNDVFPGGMLMMMLVDPPTFFIDETL